MLFKPSLSVLFVAQLLVAVLALPPLLDNVCPRPRSLALSLTPNQGHRRAFAGGQGTSYKVPRLYKAKLQRQLLLPCHTVAHCTRKQQRMCQF